MLQNLTEGSEWISRDRTMASTNLENFNVSGKPKSMLLKSCLIKLARLFITNIMYKKKERIISNQHEEELDFPISRSMCDQQEYIQYKSFS